MKESEFGYLKYDKKLIEIAIKFFHSEIKKKTKTILLILAGVLLFGIFIIFSKILEIIFSFIFHWIFK